MDLNSVLKTELILEGGGVMCFLQIHWESLTKVCYRLFIKTLDQGFSKFTFKGPNLNHHQPQKVRNNCYYKTCFYKHAYNFI